MTFASAPLITWTVHVTKHLIVFVRTVINSITHIALVNTAAGTLTPVVTWTRRVIYGDTFVLSIQAVLFPVVQEKGRNAVAMSTRVVTLSTLAVISRIQSRHTIAVQCYGPSRDEI